MKVNFYATLRSLVGGKTVEVELGGNEKLHEVLEHLTGQFPLLQPEFWNPDGSLARHVHVFLNGRGVIWLPEKLDTQLKPEDVVDIFPPVGGG